MRRNGLGGASLVEAAVVAPLMVSLIMLAFLGRAAYGTQMVADAAAAEGARYATLHPDATSQEVAAWARAQIGEAGEEVEVTVETAELPDQDYVMRVTDADGAWRSAEARTARERVSVTVSVPMDSPGVPLWHAKATHSGVRSVEGLPR